MENPVVFLAFANDNDNHLPLLDEERRVISDHLLPLANNNFIQLFVEPTAQITDLTKYITDFKNRVIVFHYGGHASSSRIFLTDQEADAQGVALLLGQQENLKLVFLNGCSTLEQVDLLFSHGIPAVIATSVPVEDPSAREFADKFYAALGRDHSIEEAFNLAAANHQMRGKDLPVIHRGLQLNNSQEESMPWGLYVSEEHADVLQWKIPKKMASSFIVRGAQMSYSNRGSINEKLIETIANTIESYSQKVQGLVAEARRRRRKPKMRDLRAAVIDSFPTPLATHLRKLLLSEEISTMRLRKIVNVYSVSVRMLSYVLLAQLWDELHRDPDFHIPPDQRSLIDEFFHLSAESALDFDYVKLIRAIGDSLEANDKEPFVKEFLQLRKEFYENKAFEEAYLFLEEMREELRSSIDADEIESFCVQAEDQLCEIFTHIGFSANYTMVAVKNIELEKRRHYDPEFRHNIVILDRITASFGILDEALITNGFVENECVVLLSNEEELSPYLNLSPFIIDENALSGQHNSKIFFLEYFVGNAIHYQLTDNLKDRLVVNDNQYPSVYDQMEEYKKLIFK